ncbi:P-loop containing nucleoside triphosphate hydrolase protein [Protomyces lactucae-debilis]|uniref:RNA helicase n=1 Tax=Protomyces lactucae-debilis TaxID=2754530 RepID=A0A1Y2FNA8_PROLT|nr:P-loop containing nucleoside triphosphate hydrolase protein [Protomyces lactucae-debilis]ORY85077.1 P-loop containing nucleoside triphosphate hydrolase protein [Protomyces lactucae-debilis]
MPYPKKRKHTDGPVDSSSASSKKQKDESMLKGTLKHVAASARAFTASASSQAPQAATHTRSSGAPVAAKFGFGSGGKQWKKLVTPLPEGRQPTRHQQRSGRSTRSGHAGESQRNRGAQSRGNRVLHTEEYINNSYELPRAADYGLAKEPVDYPSELLAAANLLVQRDLTRQAANAVCAFRCRLTVELDGLLLKCIGDGKSAEQAKENADLHAIAQLHQQGLLKTILPGGEHASVSKDILVLQKDPRLDIINFAARHDCLPTFSIRSRRSRLKSREMHRATVEIKELGLIGHGTASQLAMAEKAACVALKVAAEQMHEQTGDGTLLVKDYTKLTLASAKQFVEFYCYHFRARHVMDAQIGKGLKGRSSSWLASITLHMPQAEGVTADTTALPVAEEDGVETKSRTERTFVSELAGANRKDGEDLAYISAALVLKRESPDVWKKFVKEMKRGNGEVLKPLKPIDIDVDYTATTTMQSTIREVSKVQQRDTREHQQDEPDAGRQQRTHHYRVQRLSSQEHEKKSATMLSQYNRYLQEPSLGPLREKREALPMVQYRDQVMKLVLDNDICVVVGATGSGKTTQLPQLILEHETLNGAGSACNIICTQPRRIAAVSVAQRVAVERDEKLQDSIGYQVRFDAKLPQYGGSVTYCTTGILLRQLQDNQETTLDSISHIIVDEVHERDLQIDFLLVVLKQLLNARREAGKSPVKLILMSATIDTTLFCKYFGQNFEGGRCPFIEVPGRTFPVTHHPLEEIVDVLKGYDRKLVTELGSRDTAAYVMREITEAPTFSISAPVSERNSEDGDERAVIDWKSQGIVGEDGELDVGVDKEDTTTPVGLMSLTIGHLLKTTTDGSILVFLPGLAEITALNRLLTTTKPLGVDIVSEPMFKIYMLHSAIPQMQQEVFEKLAPGYRKIILSTNIAETSITIPDVVYVVDSGKHRETQYDQAKRISALISTWISKSNSRQRAGRAGRVQHGHYYSMISEKRYESLEVAPQPEILRTDLQDLCLQIKSMGIEDIRGFLQQAIEPPSPAAVEASVDHLQALAALDENEALTPLGRVLSLLPVRPSLGKMVLLGSIFKCLDPVLIMASAAEVKDPFLRPLEKRGEADDIKLGFAAGTGSDVLAVVHAFQQWRSVRAEQGMAAAKDWCFRNFLHFGSMVQLARTCEQTLETVSKTGLLAPARKQRGMAKMFGTPEENMNANSLALQAALATAGFYPNLAVQTFNARLLRTASDNAAVIHPSSLAAPKRLNGNRHGRIPSESVIPVGALFVYAQKTQADGSQIALRGCTRTSPLSVVLFGGESKQDGPLIRVDEWVPFYTRGEQKSAIMRFNQLLRLYLERTFANLGMASMEHLLGRGGRGGTGSLMQDPVRDPLVRGVVGALDQAYKVITRTRAASFVHHTTSRRAGYAGGRGGGMTSGSSARSSGRSFAGARGDQSAGAAAAIDSDFADLFAEQKRR